MTQTMNALLSKLWCKKIYFTFAILIKYEPGFRKKLMNEEVECGHTNHNRETLQKLLLFFGCFFSIFYYDRLFSKKQYISFVIHIMGRLNVAKNRKLQIIYHGTGIPRRPWPLISWSWPWLWCPFKCFTILYFNNIFQ